MVLQLPRRSLWIAVMLTSLAALRCTPDERRLAEKSLGASVAGSSAGSSAGSNASAGVGGADTESQAGDAGEAQSAGGQTSHAGQTGSSAGVGGDFAGAGGSVIADPGGNGTVNGGGAAGAGTGGGASAGAGGTSFDSPCGDIDHNGVDDCTETLVLDSRFDTDLAHWTAGSNLSQQTWDARDARSKPGSGSILVINQVVAQVDASVMAGSEQCIPVTEGTKYEVAARVMIPTGQGLGQAGLNLYVFAGDKCSGVFLSGLTPGLTAQTGAWVTADNQVEMPAAARSVLVRLVASKPFTQEKLSALFDDILVHPLH